MKRVVLTALAIGTAFIVASHQANADTVTFEGFTTGTSVNNQGGWTVEDEFGNGRPDIPLPPFDEEVVDDGTGNTVWRVSNAVHSTSFSDQPYSHTSPGGAGETGSALWNDRGPDHTSPLSPPNPGGPVTSTTFESSFQFRSATGAAQSGLAITVSPSAKQSPWRNSFISITDDGVNGFDISFFETGVSADPFGATANFPEVASDLSYSDWHTIGFSIQFVDGVNGDTTGNDIVTITVDGVDVFTGTTWESFYFGTNPAGLGLGDQPQRQAIDSLMFRISSGAPGTEGAGFFIDNVTVAVPEPTSVAFLGLGGLLLLRRRRRSAAGA